jgi:hypothetical protein
LFIFSLLNSFVDCHQILPVGALTKCMILLAHQIAGSQTACAKQINKVTPLFCALGLLSPIIHRSYGSYGSQARKNFAFATSRRISSSALLQRHLEYRPRAEPFFSCVALWLSPHPSQGVAVRRLVMLLPPDNERR